MSPLLASFLIATAPMGEPDPSALLQMEQSGAQSRTLMESPRKKPRLASELVELVKDRGYVLELIVSCGASPGIMHFDKMKKIYLGSDNRMYTTFDNAHRATCGA